MIIVHIVHNSSEAPRYPEFRSDVVIRQTRIPPFHLNPLRWFLFFRDAKKCMILIWAVSDRWSNRVPSPVLSFFRFCARVILKKPWSGPGVAFDSWKTKSDLRLRALADVRFSNEAEFVTGLKQAYFSGECGNPDRGYLLPLNQERLFFLKTQSQGKLLEMGCATGYVLNWLGGGTGIDLDELRVEYAQKKYPASRFLIEDATKTSFKNSEFDAVLIPEILEHVPYDVAGQIVKEALRVGKKLVITVPNADKPNYDKELVENPDHVWFPTHKLMRQLLGEGADIFESKNQDFLYAVIEK